LIDKVHHFLLLLLFDLELEVVEAVEVVLE
jgi:hypothetical protein